MANIITTDTAIRFKGSSVSKTSLEKVVDLNYGEAGVRVSGPSISIQIFLTDTINGQSFSTVKELRDYVDENFFKGGTGPSTDGVQSVSGDTVDNTDPQNPIVFVPILTTGPNLTIDNDEINLGGDDSDISTFSPNPVVIGAGNNPVYMYSYLDVSNTGVYQHCKSSSYNAYSYLSSSSYQVTIQGFSLYAQQGKLTVNAYSGYGPVIGMQYGADYSTEGKTLDRWIPDWKAVKDYVDENSSDVASPESEGKVAKYTNIGAINTAEPQFPENAVPLSFLNERISANQRAAINALVSPETDYADMTEATAAIKAIIDALKAT